MKLQQTLFGNESLAQLVDHLTSKPFVTSVPGQLSLIFKRSRKKVSVIQLFEQFIDCDLNRDLI